VYLKLGTGPAASVNPQRYQDGYRHAAYSIPPQWCASALQNKPFHNGTPLYTQQTPPALNRHWRTLAIPHWYLNCAGKRKNR